MTRACLIDTSAWVEFFQGREPVASAVDAALADGSAAVCGMVELEIRQGLRPGEDDLTYAARVDLPAVDPRAGLCPGW